MSDRQLWRPPVPPKPTSAALQASNIAARNAKPALGGSNDAPATYSTSKAALAAAVTGRARAQVRQDVYSRHTSSSPTRGRPQLALDLDDATKRLEQSTRKELQAPSQRPRTTSELAARLASASSSPASRPADTPPQLRPSPRKAGFMSREPSASDRERSGSEAGATRYSAPQSKSPDRIDFGKITPLAASTTSPHALALPFGLSNSIARASSQRSQTRPHNSSLDPSPPKMSLPKASQNVTSQSPPILLRPASPANPHYRKHSASLGETHKPRIRATSTLSVPAVRHTRVSPRRTPASSPNPSADADRIKDVNNLANAMVGASIASTRGLSRASSPDKQLPLPGPRRRSQSLHALEVRKRPEPPPLKPMTMRPMKQTLRKQHSHDDDEEHKRGRKLRLRKHPNVHHEGDRKRWRDKLTAKQRKRYEGLWASNRSLLHEFETVDHHRKGIPAEDLVLSAVVRDIWERSRLPRDVLEEIWDLVAEEGDRALGREQFVAGLWLIDQRLKGRKLPVKVSPSVWASVRHTQGVKISSKRL